MGCDIHTFREVRRNGQWETLESTYEEDEGTEEEPEIVIYLNQAYSSRNYPLFGLLCDGVRRSWDFSWQERGLPHDVSPEVKADSDRWDSDGHSHSWLGLIEMREKVAELLLQSSEEATHCGQYLREMLDQLEWPEDAAPEDCRIVFWFDN